MSFITTVIRGSSAIVHHMHPMSAAARAFKVSGVNRITLRHDLCIPQSWIDAIVEFHDNVWPGVLERSYPIPNFKYRTSSGLSTKQASFAFGHDVLVGCVRWWIDCLSSEEKFLPDHSVYLSEYMDTVTARRDGMDRLEKLWYNDRIFKFFAFLRFIGDNLVLEILDQFLPTLMWGCSRAYAEVHKYRTHEAYEIAPHAVHALLAHPKTAIEDVFEDIECNAKVRSAPMCIMFFNLRYVFHNLSTSWKKAMVIPETVFAKSTPEQLYVSSLFHARRRACVLDDDEFRKAVELNAPGRESKLCFHEKKVIPFIVDKLITNFPLADPVHFLRRQLDMAKKHGTVLQTFLVNMLDVLSGIKADDERCCRGHLVSRLILMHLRKFKSVRPAPHSAAAVECVSSILKCHSCGFGVNMFADALASEGAGVWPDTKSGSKLTVAHWLLFDSLHGIADKDGYLGANMAPDVFRYAVEFFERFQRNVPLQKPRSVKRKMKAVEEELKQPATLEQKTCDVATGLVAQSIDDLVCHEDADTPITELAGWSNESSPIKFPVAVPRHWHPDPMLPSFAAKLSPSFAPLPAKPPVFGADVEMMADFPSSLFSQSEYDFAA